MRRFLAILVTWGLKIKIIMRNRATVKRITRKTDSVDSSRGCGRTGILTQIPMLGDIKQHNQEGAIWAVLFHVVRTFDSSGGGGFFVCFFCFVCLLRQSLTI